MSMEFTPEPSPLGSDDNDDENNNGNENDNESNHDISNDQNDDENNQDLDTTLRLKDIMHDYFEQNADICDQTADLTDQKDDAFEKLLNMMELINSHNTIEEIGLHVCLLFYNKIKVSIQIFCCLLFF